MDRLSGVAFLPFVIFADVHENGLRALFQPLASLFDRYFFYLRTRFVDELEKTGRVVHREANVVTAVRRSSSQAEQKPQRVRNFWVEQSFLWPCPDAILTGVDRSSIRAKRAAGGYSRFASDGAGMQSGYGSQVLEALTP